MFIKRKYNLNNWPKMETFHKITTSLFHKQVRASPTPYKGNKIIKKTTIDVGTLIFWSSFIYILLIVVTEWWYKKITQ